MKKFIFALIVLFFLFGVSLFSLQRSFEYQKNQYDLLRLHSLAGHILVYEDTVRYINPVDLAIYSYIPEDMTFDEYLSIIAVGILPEELDMISTEDEVMDTEFTQKNKGRIFIDSQRTGQYWYVLADGTYRVAIDEGNFLDSFGEYAQVLNEDDKEFIEFMQYN